MGDKLKLEKLRGDDGYGSFSLRAKMDLIRRLDEVASATGRSRNDVAVRFLEFALNNFEIV